LANEHVSIVTVCQMLGVELPDDIGTARSRKVHCPFGEMYHSDHGASPAMRIYPDTNSAYCFSCAAYYTPVSLAARAMDADKITTATRLLDRVGYRPMDLAEAWRAAQHQEPDPNRALLADALKTFCRRIDPRWSQRQFDPQIAATLTRCLSLLELVHSAPDVTLWLSNCKTAMRRALYTPQSSLSEKFDVLLDAQRERGSHR
jgi:hypothetical protein